MAVLTTQVERESEQFARRREQMEALVAELRERAAEVTRGGGERPPGDFAGELDRDHRQGREVFRRTGSHRHDHREEILGDIFSHLACEDVGAEGEHIPIRRNADHDPPFRVGHGPRSGFRAGREHGPQHEDDAAETAEEPPVSHREESIALAGVGRNGGGRGFLGPTPARLSGRSFTQRNPPGK